MSAIATSRRERRRGIGRRRSRAHKAKVDVGQISADRSVSAQAEVAADEEQLIIAQQRFVRPKIACGEIFDPTDAALWNLPIEPIVRRRGNGYMPWRRRWPRALGGRADLARRKKLDNAQPRHVRSKPEAAEVRLNARYAPAHWRTRCSAPAILGHGCRTRDR